VHEQVPPYRAYVLAGYRPHESNPYRLSENERVKQYTYQLEARTMKRHEVTVDSLITELEEARLNAKEAKQPSSEVSAIMGKAKVTGLLVDKQEVKQVSDMGMEELVQVMCEAYAAASREEKIGLRALARSQGVEDDIFGDWHEVPTEVIEVATQTTQSS